MSIQGFDGRRMRQMRENLGYSQTELGQRVKDTVGGNAEIVQQTISHWENGRMKPREEYIVAIAEVLGVSTDWLLCRTTIPNPITASDLSPSEQDLINAFRAKDAQKIMNIVTGNHR